MAGNWKNYGDVNFAEHGGQMVRPTWSEEELKEFPNLRSQYDVFSLMRISDDLMHAYLSQVDTDDFAEYSNSIEYIYGYIPETDEEKACKLADYIGPQPGVDRGYLQKGMYSRNKDFFLTPTQAVAWMKELSIL